jgi:hypothetical protein
LPDARLDYLSVREAIVRIYDNGFTLVETGCDLRIFLVSLADPDRSNKSMTVFNDEYIPIGAVSEERADGHLDRLGGTMTWAPGRMRTASVDRTSNTSKAFPQSVRLPW